MDIHLVDGTYELFRHYYALPSAHDGDGNEVAAARGVLRSVLGMIKEGATHIAVATDHVIESFRNGLWPGYKTSEGIEPELLAQFPLLEDVLSVAEMQIPQVEIKSSTRRIIVEIALQGGVSDSYDVHLETKQGKGPLWSARVGPVISPAGDARLVFDVPTRGIESNFYSFVVSSTSPRAGELRHYDFQVKLAM